jgi:hypothetical protein
MDSNDEMMVHQLMQDEANVSTDEDDKLIIIVALLRL